MINRAMSHKNVLRSLRFTKLANGKKKSPLCIAGIFVYAFEPIS